MIKVCTAVLIGLVVSPSAIAQRNLNFTGDFESGEILPNDSRDNGFYIHTLPHPQLRRESVESGHGGFGPDSGLDTRVVRSEVVGGETVNPRRGEFFLRSALYFDKDYSELNGGSLNKPRSKIYMSHEDNKFDFDEEGYLAFSIYLPKDFEHETAVNDNRGAFHLYQGISEGASWITWVLEVFVPDGDVAHWLPYVNVNDKSVRSGGKTQFDLGPVTDDLGKWTDFIVRYRFNPFSVTTNPAQSGIPNSKNQSYQGNKGIFQMWKSVGDVDNDGNREMRLVINMENEPVGIVPHATERISHLFRIYKYGWHKSPSNVRGPVWIGFDEIRDGRVRDGTQYSDVHPAQFRCTHGCPGGISPLPPTSLEIAE